MRDIIPGTDRWDEIQAHAERLRAEGQLDYVNLKKAGRCGGDVAQRIINALKADMATGVQPSAGHTNAGATVGMLPPQYQARWDACAAQQHRIAVESLETMTADQVSRLTSEVSRHHGEVRELRTNLEAALDDVEQYSTQASDAQDKLVASEADVVTLRTSLASALARCVQVAASLTTAEASLRETQATAHADRTCATAACARVEADATHWRSRAETAEGALADCRTELAAANTRAARLEGERDAGLRIQEDLRTLLQSRSDMRAARALPGATKGVTSAK